MFHTLNAENRDKMVEVAMVSRCLIVGFRYFRQSDANKVKLLQLVAHSVNEVLGASPFMLVGETLNIKPFFTKLAQLHNIENPEGWASDIMFLISPTLWNDGRAATTEGALEAWAIVLSAVPASIARCQIFTFAVMGNQFMTREYNRIFEEEAVVFDEDCYPEAVYEIPVVVENWQPALFERRSTQMAYAAYFLEHGNVEPTNTDDEVIGSVEVQDEPAATDEPAPNGTADDFDA